MSAQTTDPYLLTLLMFHSFLLATSLFLNLGLVEPYGCFLRVWDLCNAGITLTPNSTRLVDSTYIADLSLVNVATFLVSHPPSPPPNVSCVLERT